MRFLLATSLIFCAVAVLCVGTWLWLVSRTLPDAAQLARYTPPITSRIHAGDGKLVAEFARQHRAYVPIEELPQELIDAFISAEDKNFFVHSGLDPMGILRAAIRTFINLVTGRGGLQGGSTITQQVAKNMLLSNEQTLMRKIKEAMVALRIEKIFSKSEILELYMNEIYLGGRSYGVGSASLNYFNKSLSDLTLAECALLAALPKAPGSVNPYLRPQAAQDRRDWVLRRMIANGYIDDALARLAMAEPLTTVPRLKGDEIVASRYFVEEARREVLKLFDTPEQGEKALYEGGLSIRSTLDTRLQLVARQVLWAGLETYDRRRGWRGPVDMLDIEGVSSWQEILAAYSPPPGASERGWSKAIVLEVSADNIELGLVDGRRFALVEQDRQWIRDSIAEWKKRAEKNRKSWLDTQERQVSEKAAALARLEALASRRSKAAASIGGAEEEADAGDESGQTIEAGTSTGEDASTGEEAAQEGEATGEDESTQEKELLLPDFDSIIPPLLQVGHILLVSREEPYDLQAKPIDNIARLRPGPDTPWRVHQLPAVEGALVTMDPHTGRILAMTGGYSFDRSQFNRAVQAKRQPGSSFKPFVYAAALDNGFTPVSKILDAPFVIETRQGLYKPSNYSDRFYGLSTLRLGLEKSRNLMTVRLAQEIGLEVVSDYGRNFGLYDHSMNFLSAALGAGETTPIKMAAAYSMLVNGGKRVRPTLIDRTQDRKGRNVFRRDARLCRGCNAEWNGQEPPELPDVRDPVLDPITSYQIVSMMEGVVKRGTARTVRAAGKPVAGKTGTTNDFLDAWFVGFSPDLVACVWVGFDSPHSLGFGETGGRVAAPIFRDFMKIALRDAPDAPFRIPSGVRLVEIDAVSGTLSNSQTRNKILEAFRPGTEPSDREPESSVNSDEDWISLMRQGSQYAPAPEQTTDQPANDKPVISRQLEPVPSSDSEMSLDEGVY